MKCKQNNLPLRDRLGQLQTCHLGTTYSEAKPEALLNHRSQMATPNTKTVFSPSCLHHLPCPQDKRSQNMTWRTYRPRAGAQIAMLERWWRHPTRYDPTETKEIFLFFGMDDAFLDRTDEDLVKWTASIVLNIKDCNTGNMFPLP